MKNLVTLALLLGLAGCGQDPGPQQPASPASAEPPAAASNSGYTAVNPPVVDVTGGSIKGFVEEGTLAFLGIPYATAERFMMPQPVAPWDGVRSAQVYGETCPIPQQTTASWDEFVWPHLYWSENENCQFINVWTQTLDKSAKKPVMIFLHGGGFTNGSSIEALAYEGRNLSQFGDVVVVTLNHRLNVLGSLNLEAYGDEYQKSGNTGMADIEAALNWVQANIATFGGDAGNITVFGQSGGSGKLVHLMAMPSAEGLFHRGIAHSTGTASHLTVAQSEQIAAAMVAAAGSVDALKTLPYYDLLALGEAALAKISEETGTEVGWRPIVDEEYILSTYADWSADMPFIAGTTFSERTSTYVLGDGRKNEWSDDEIEANLAERYGDNAAAIAGEFKTLFPDKKVQDAYFYDASYRTRIYQTLERRLSQSNGPVYNYLFAYEAPVNGGVTPFHCADLIYVFHNVDLPKVKVATGADASTYAAQDQIAQDWVNFACTGKPSIDGVEWGEFSLEGRGTMVFDEDSSFSAFDDRNLVELIGASL